MGITLKDLERNCENCLHSIYSNGNEKFICDSDRIECKAMYRSAELDGLKYPNNCGGFEVKTKIKRNNNRYRLNDGLILQFITAGNSYFVLHSTKTNEDFAFNVKTRKENCVNSVQQPNLWFVYNWQSMYIGAIKFDRDRLFQYKMNENLVEDKQRVREMKTLAFVMSKAYKYEDVENLEFYHTGFCARCGKPLKNEKLQLTMGFGTYCAQQIKDEYFRIIYEETKEKM